MDLILSESQSYWKARLPVLLSTSLIPGHSLAINEGILRNMHLSLPNLKPFNGPCPPSGWNPSSRIWPFMIQSASLSWHISCCFPTRLHFTPAASPPSAWGPDTSGSVSQTGRSTASSGMEIIFPAKCFLAVGSMCWALGTWGCVGNSRCSWKRREEHTGRRWQNEWGLEVWTKVDVFGQGLIVLSSWSTGWVVGRDKRWNRRSRQEGPDWEWPSVINTRLSFVFWAVGNQLRQLRQGMTG